MNSPICEGLIMGPVVLKALYESGAIKNFQAQPAPMSSGWYLVVTKSDGVEAIVETARGGARVFASLDTLVSHVQALVGKLPQALRFSF